MIGAMLLGTIVACSLVLQAVTIAFALQLISVTGWKNAWIFLSLGITSMGIRRLMTLSFVFSGVRGEPGLVFELVGLAGSALTLAGVILIKPIFLSIKEAERSQRELASALQKAHSEIKVLSGLLPICSFCKKIRDEQGNWNAMEAYISRHSEAQFTHGLCPECRARHYSEIPD